MPLSAKEHHGWGSYVSPSQVKTWLTEDKAWPKLNQLKSSFRLIWAWRSINVTYICIQESQLSRCTIEYWITMSSYLVALFHHTSTQHTHHLNWEQRQEAKVFQFCVYSTLLLRQWLSIIHDFNDSTSDEDEWTVMMMFKYDLKCEGTTCYQLNFWISLQNTGGSTS